MHLICCSRKFPTTSRTPPYFRGPAASQYCDHTQPKETVIHFASQMGFQVDYLLLQISLVCCKVKESRKKKSNSIINELD